jgi:hypothetical protein
MVYYKNNKTVWKKWLHADEFVIMGGYKGIIIL